MFESFGFPLSIYSDNGPKFRGPFREFCDKFGIAHVTSSPYNPSSNGLAESAVKICKSLLRKLKTSGEKHKTLSEILSTWRNIPRTEHCGLSPADMMFGFCQRIPGLPQLRVRSPFLERDTIYEHTSERKALNFERRGGWPN